MTSLSARRVAWALWGLASAVLLIGGAINVIEPATIDPNLPNGRALLLSAPLLVLIELAFPTLGALVIARHPRNAVGWLIYVGGLAETIRFTTKAVGSLVEVRGDVLSLGYAMSLLHQEGHLLAVPLLTIALLLFPNGRLPSARWRPLALLMVCGAALMFVLSALGSWMRSSGPELGGMLPAAGLVFAVTTWLRQLELLAVVAAAGSLVVRFRTSDERTRQQIKWVAAASIVAAIAFAAFWLPGGWAWASTLGPLELPVELAYVLGFVGLPASIAIAMLRHRLFDIDVIINRALVYGATVAAIGALYMSAVVGLQAVLRPITQGDELPVALSTLGAIALFTPVRARVRGAVDRRFYRSRYDATRTLDSLALRLRDQVDLDALRGELLTAVRDTMQPAHVSLWLRERAR